MAGHDHRSECVILEEVARVAKGDSLQFFGCRSTLTLRDPKGQSSRAPREPCKKPTSEEPPGLLAKKDPSFV